MQEQELQFDPKQSADILKCLRTTGCKLDDIAVMNILYLLCALREPTGLHILDSIFIEHAAKTERSLAYLSKAIDTSRTRNNLVLFPLFKRRHWSLLVFVSPLRCYAHFDSFEGLEHSMYASALVRIIDAKKEYQPLALPQACVQQESDWECGYFVLMSAYMMIDMKLEHLQSEDTLRYYLKRQMPSLRQHNVHRFIQKLDVIISELWKGGKKNFNTWMNKAVYLYEYEARLFV